MILVKVLIHLGTWARLIAEATAVSFRRPPAWALIRDQLWHIGVLSIPVVAITGISTGLILASQGYFQLADLGMLGSLGLLVGKSMVTELGPVLTAVMVTGRVGAAMCAELGTMRVSEQIDALRSMSVNPFRYLVAPRFIAGTLMLPPLTVFSMMLGILGGYVITVYHFNVPPTVYLEAMPNNISRFDIISGLTKSFIFGIVIVTVACYKGLSTKGGAAGVGRATTTSVVISYSVILFSNFILNLLLNYINVVWFPWL